MNSKVVGLLTWIVLAPSGLAGQAALTSPHGQLDVRSGYVRVGPDSIFYEVAGEGPALILIHDGLVHREIWDHQFASFSRRYTVVRYDRRGYGASSPGSVPYSDVADLERLYAHLGIAEAGLVGMSSGGRMAIEFTLEHPDMASPP